VAKYPLDFPQNRPQTIPSRRVMGKVYLPKELGAARCRRVGCVRLPVLISTSIVASRWGVLCQVLERFIASVDRGFGGFGGVAGLDKVLRGRREASRGGGWRCGERAGGQFGRSACGFTPACGRVEPTHRAKPWPMNSFVGVIHEIIAAFPLLIQPGGLRGWDSSWKRRRMSWQYEVLRGFFGCAIRQVRESRSSG
jgi:hypothetical protein